MKNKSRRDIEAGAEALKRATTNTENNLSEYSGSPMPGSVMVPCKTENCNAAIESGFVYNMEEWIQGFVEKPRTCPACNSTHVYSRADVVPVPSK